MVKELQVMEKRIRINPKDPTRLDYWHDGANKWMDDGGVPGNVVDLEQDDTHKSCVILYMSNGKKYRRDIYQGYTNEIKEKKRDSKEESNTEEPPKKSLLSILWGFLAKKKKKEPEMGSYEMPPMMGGMIPPTMPNDTSSKESSSTFVKILKAIWWIVKLPFKILKFIYKMIPG